MYEFELPERKGGKSMDEKAESRRCFEADIASSSESPLRQRFSRFDEAAKSERNRIERIRELMKKNPEVAELLDLLSQIGAL